MHIQFLELYFTENNLFSKDKMSRQHYFSNEWCSNLNWSAIMQHRPISRYPEDIYSLDDKEHTVFDNFGIKLFNLWEVFSKILLLVALMK